MDNREPLLRSDWTVYRGGAILMTDAENCELDMLFLDQVGGNAIFLNKHNRKITIRRTHIANAGGNGVAFVGDPGAVRNPLFEYGERQNLKDLDLTPGPKTDDYPADCVLEDSLIERTGRVEKQTAPVEISMAQDITVRHCSLYDVPRAGINISEGTWGGHIIEFNDVFDTVKETGDHGSINSWGRDRYWGLKDIDANTLTFGPNRSLPLLDAVKPVILRNNRFRCDHGWDIDLDDGTSNFQLYNNLALNGGIKLREGFFRTVENNIMVNNSFHPHVWYKGSEDVFRNNIVFTPYKPIRVGQPWGKDVDNNLRHVPGQTVAAAATELRKQSARDEHSLEADAQFVDPATGDYRVKPGSPALQLGFKNFPMDQFGVQWPALKRIARTPELPILNAPQPTTLQSTRDARPATWLGATVKNIVGIGEVSASGLPDETGVLIVEVPASSRAAAAGLRKGDVVLKLAGKPTATLQALQRLSQETPALGTVTVTVWRGQKELNLEAAGPVR
ncbi:MAG: PDZ domain-containing protein [Acidobacteriia bacterium]|nr:PDZ domain-containing protein [Terriglobia bacterium]